MGLQTYCSCNNHNRGDNDKFCSDNRTNYDDYHWGNDNVDWTNDYVDDYNTGYALKQDVMSK